MKAIVISDSHGNYFNVKRILDKHPDVDYIIHLGDGEDDLAEINMENPSLAKKVIYVGGNCDMGMHKRTAIFDFSDIKIFLAHGDNYKIKTDKTVIAEVARENGCHAAFFGHSYLKFNEIIDGIQLLNPGSCSIQADNSKPSYALVENKNGQLVIDILDI